METPHLCPMSPIKIQHSKWELGDLQNIEHHITTQTNCQHPAELKHWVLSEPVKGSTPLLMACDRGNLDSVKHIVEKWQMDVNATGAYYIFFGPFAKFELKALDASPLFVAAYRCHYEMVRYLVEKGANIFAETSENEDSCLDLSGLTPFYGSILSSDSTISTRQQDAIVRFLLESVGSTSSALARLTALQRPPFQTPIWNMFRRDSGSEATITLVKYGMNVNDPYKFGTILTHWASKSLCFNDGSHEGSLLELVQLLVEMGADLTTPDFQGYTPLFLAAMPGYRTTSLNFSVFDFLLERQEYGRLDKIDALEFAGAVILSFSSDATQVPRAISYWRRAHHLRYLDGGDPTPKTPIIFKKAPQHIEWTTLPQLEEIENDPSQHKIASLLVILRILFVPNCWMDVHRYLNGGLMVLAAYQYQEFTEAAVDSFTIALEFILRYDRKQPFLWSDTVKIVEKLVALLTKKPHRCTSEILQTSAELITAADQSHLPQVKSNYRCCGDYVNILSHLKTLLGFVSVLATHPDKMNNGIMDALTQLVKQDGRTEDGLNLLLLACTMARYGGPDLPPVVRLLLRARANPNAVDLRFRTPLHLLANLNTVDQERVNLLGNLLVEKGAHPYMVDEEGRTAADIWLLLRNQGPKRHEDHRVWDRSDLPDWCVEDVQELVCYSATIVRRFRIPYVDKIPATLYPFLEKH